MERAELDIRQILLSIKRRALLAIAVTCAFTALGAAHLYLSTPIFSSSALILFNPNEKNLLEATTSSNTGNQASARVDSEVEFVRSDAVLLETMQQPQLGAELLATTPSQGIASTALAALGLANSDPAPADEAVHAALTKLRQSTTIRRIGATYVIEITARSTNPAVAAQIANGIAETYISAQVRHKVANLNSHRAILAQHLELARQDLLEADAERLALINGPADGFSQLSDPNITEADRATSLLDSLHNEALARAQYQNLSQRLQDLAAQSDLQVADSHVLSAAIVPLTPSSPNYPLTLSLSLLAGSMAGVALALLYDQMIVGFVTEEQMTTTLRLKDAAVVPRARPRTDVDSVAELIVEDPTSPYTEAVRRLHATICFATRATPPTTDRCLVIMVCSAEHGEGKTTLAVALARCFARAGSETLLIDGELRNPSVHQHLKIGPSLALIDTLATSTQEIDFFRLATSDPLTTLQVVVGANHATASATDLLSGAAFTRLIVHARSQFDVVIIDTAPLGELADTLYIAPFAQVALLVTKWASTPQRAVKKALHALRTAGQPNLLVIPVLSQQNETTFKPKAHPHHFRIES